MERTDEKEALFSLGTRHFRLPLSRPADAGCPNSGLFLVVAIFLSIQTQRLHDFGFSGWWIIGVNAAMFLFTYLDPPLSLVEILSFAWAIGIGLVPPQASANKYGPNSDENGRFWECELPDNPPQKSAS